MHFRDSKTLLLAGLVLLLAGGLSLYAHAARTADSRVRASVQILVDTPTHESLRAEIEQYRVDAARALAPKYGNDISVAVRDIDLASYFPHAPGKNTDQNNSDETGQNRLTADIAIELQSAYRADGLVGIVLVGSVPLPRAYTREGTAELSLYPWIDFDTPAFVRDPALERYVRSEEDEPHPEIWSGVFRIPGDSQDGSLLITGPLAPTPSLAAVFAKNHQLHAGQVHVQRRVLFNDTWGESDMRDIKLPNGQRPSDTDLPGGSELARRSLAERFGARFVATTRYKGVNFADDSLPKKIPDDQSKTLDQLLKKASSSEVTRWRDGDGKLKDIDVASQVILYFDAWTRDLSGRLGQAAGAGAQISGKPGFNLFSRDGYSFCADGALSSANSYFSLPEAKRAAIAAASGFGDRALFEFVLRWTRIYTPAEKRLALIRDGIPPFGKYRGSDNTYELRLTVAAGVGSYELDQAQLAGQCFQAGLNAKGRGALVDVLLGASTASESSGQKAANLAVWSLGTGITQSAYGILTGPTMQRTPPANLAQMSEAELDALLAATSTPGFGRAAAVTSTAEGTGFENDPFFLRLIGGDIAGEAFRAGFDEGSVFYGDPTLRLP